MLLGWYNQEQYRKYYPYNKDCVFIEAIAGKGGDDITINLTNKPFKLKENTAYRFYLAEVANNEISSEVGSYLMICFSESLALVSKGLPRGGIGNVAV